MMDAAATAEAVQRIAGERLTVLPPGAACAFVQQVALSRRCPSGESRSRRYGRRAVMSADQT